MNSPLNYSPAYLGLFSAQTLALACNAFLDIQYGGFATEVFLWTAAFAFTLWVGWRQHGETTDIGKRWLRRSLIFGMLISVVIFMPMWGFPRAALYVLAMLQVSYNCVTTTRRHLHLGLLISVVMVLFAASHYRADWTMLFYLVPYVTAVVFTSVAEQINRKASELRQHSLGNQVVGAQGAAIAAATAVILALGLLFYALTPQVTWLSLSWRWGQPSDVSIGNRNAHPGSGAIQPDGSSGAGGGSTASASQGTANTGQSWPSAAEMRKASERPGMPGWQRIAINGMADLTAGLEVMMKPVMQSMKQLWESVKEWLKENRGKVINMFFALAVLALLYAMWRLMREARVATWLRTRFDYLTIVLLGIHSGEVHGARTCYNAMTRLFELHEIERDSRDNTLEYLTEINSYFRHLSRETGEMTRLYEDARYGRIAGSIQVDRTRELYRRIFRLIAD